MLKFLKRPADGLGEADGGPNTPKASRRDFNAENRPSATGRDPRVLITWNCNGLTCRAQNSDQWKQFTSLIEEHKPDVVCLQEVRMPAQCDTPGARAGDGRPRRRGAPSTATSAFKKDAQLVESLLSRGVLAQYKVHYSLSDKKYAGSALLVHKEARPRRVSFTLEEGGAAGAHDSEGRVIFAEFESFDLLATYTPNNGWQEDSFRRRRTWDEKVTGFVERHRQSGGRPLIYMGDLNVAPQDIDLSHPEFFRGMKGEKPGQRLPADPEDRGQPGCTNRERQRFFELLRRGGLVDSYRILQEKAGTCLEHSEELTEGPHFTWRGNPGRDIPEHGKYFRKGMRIDHVLVSKELHATRVKRAEALGRGAFMAGFLGSDHCPLLLELGDADAKHQ